MSGTRPRVALVVLAAFVTFAVGCDGEAPPPHPAAWTIHVAADAPPGVQIAATDVSDHFAQMGLEASLSNVAPPSDCEDHVGHVVFEGDAFGAPDRVFDGDQSWSIHEVRCSGGARVALSGGGLLGRQYAAYEWLHRLGVRFFHPEQTYVPSAPRWSDAPLSIDHTPAFRWRSVSLHLTHPLELGDAFRLGREDLFPEGARYIDWTLRNGGSRGIGGIGTGELSDRGWVRGFLRETGFGLHSTQQGGRPIIDPDDPRTDEEQIAAAIDARMNADPDHTPDVFSFTFNPSEFTEIPDTDAVRQITFITNYVNEHWPETRVETINHGTHGEPTPNYGVRFYDLPQLAPETLAVKVHTLMFYDLFRPAPVYGNEDFHGLYDFMERESARRPIEYFPESAWWLTFDNAVPMYLPITLEARDRDIQGIKHMLTGGLDSHRVFGSGHEWGYWQNEYCSFRMAMDVDYRWTDCLDDITSPMGAVGVEVRAVVEDVVAAQERDFVVGWADTLAYLVGTDPETEVAQSIGIEFHPLPPTPVAILSWDQARIDTWKAQHPPALERMDAEYTAFVERLRAVEPNVPEDGLPWFAEILDGIEATGLRARHAFQVYGAVVMHREAQLRGDDALAEQALALLEEAKLSTRRALIVIHRREEGYRYAPVERAIAGGPDLDADDNWTIYKYRVHGRTHEGYYYTRIDRLAEEAIGGGGNAVFVEDALLAPAESLAIEVRDRELTGTMVDWGDMTPPATEMATRFTHTYTADDVYRMRLTAMRAADTFVYEGDVAQVAEEQHAGFTGRVLEPMGVELIEGVMPALVLGRVDAARLVVGFSPAESGRVPLGSFTVLAPDPASMSLFATEPTTLIVPIVNRSAETIQTQLLIDDARVEQVDATSPVAITGDLSTEAVIDAVVAIGGFDERGARGIVASTLGFTPDTLPATVAFRVEYDAP